MATSIAEFHARANLDASGFDDGADQMAKAMNRAARDVDNAWGIITNTSVKSAQASANVFKKSGLGEIRPVEVYSEAVGRASIETKKLWAAQIQAKVSANALRDSLGGVAGGGAAGAVANLTNAQQFGGRASARFGLLMQQAGYQVQDFSVQIAGGQNALVAFAQQGSQMLGFFGVGGAVAGAALTVGVLTARLLGLDKVTKASVPTIEDAEEAWGKYAETIGRIRFDNMTPDQQTSALGKQLEDLKKRQGVLSELAAINKKQGGLNAERLIASAEQWVFPTLEQQLKYYEAIKKAREEGRSAPSPLRDEFGGGAVSVAFNPISGPRAASALLDQISLAQAEAAKEAAEISEARLKIEGETTKELREQTKERAEAIRASVAAEGKNRQSAWQSFADARKTNALAEMGTEQQLDYFIKHLAFLDEIGARNTEEYEKTKARTRELGSILLGQSGEGNWKLGEEMEKRAKQILGLQQRMPESLRITTGANALGGAATNLTATQTLDIQKRILSAIERLVQLEVAGQN